MCGLRCQKGFQLKNLQDPTQFTEKIETKSRNRGMVDAFLCCVLQLIAGKITSFRGLHSQWVLFNPRVDFDDARAFRIQEEDRVLFVDVIC